ncbi:hypothetical protein FNV43_RR03558 [Rhamnella rubrinervis]|uniref:Las1-like family protein n=1 Tax=Rhamnella rubrinervis TaxID=2594499 RepID=A0A8K0MP74_9ROSA|nr:hypothetical protein FNV43_RR03558 [Rhamnella rubrinervis]
MEPVVLAIDEKPRVIDQYELVSESSSSSYSLKLVPWLRWDEWLFVYDSLFSDSVDIVASALRRIATWRSRGCVPVAIEVTASIIEIQLKDPYFRKEQSSDKSGANQFGDALLSEEMLAMLYCMAIIRLVNGVVEKTRKKTGISIAVAAAAIGIPRMLIDVRHEGSHRELPALPWFAVPQLRNYGGCNLSKFCEIMFPSVMNALDWLKVYYWEPQKKEIPFQGRKEIKGKLKELAFCLKAKQHPQSGSSLTKGKRGIHNELFCVRNKFLSHVAGKLHSSQSGGSKKQVIKVLKNLVGLYSSFSSEVVSVLLDLLLKALKSSGLVELPVDAQLFPSIDTLLYEWKLVITKFSNKEPELPLALLRAVLDVIETQETMEYDMDDRPEDCQVEHLSFLFTWLVRIFKELKPRHKKDSANKIKVSSAETTVSKELLVELLLSPDPNVIEDDSSHLNLKNLLIQQEESISQAAKKLELIKLRRRMKANVMKTADAEVSSSIRWVVAKSWNPCPIGMLPRAVGSSGRLPVLNCNDDQSKVMEISQTNEKWELKPCSRKREASSDNRLLDDSSIKRKRVAFENCISNGEDVSLSEGFDGHLMIGGVWKKVGEEDLFAIESSVRILV